MSSQPELQNIDRMDHRIFEFSLQQRDEIICSESLFDQSSLQPNELSNELTYLSKRRIKTHLHAITLSDYIRQGIIPRGLRWQKEPMLGQRTDDFCDRWCAILNKCSFDLMTLLVDHLKKQLDDLDNQIDEKKSALLEMAPNDDKIKEVLKANEEMQKKLAKEIKETKIRKFNRDKKDALEGKIYLWRSTEKRQNRSQREDLSSDQLSTASSSSFLSNTSMYERNKGKRLQQRSRGAPHGGGRGQRPWTRSRVHHQKI
ncbi:hypothetical protein WMY93_012782 [Mugilogobius chulae]|uniref:Uncharacterized protein n=1 Tax=Mugilogobius chulae TaxID=88201 RepID=A0AAW0P9Y9_9GOBI